MRRISKTFVSLFALGVAAAVTLTASPAFAQAMDPARADRDKWLGLAAALAIGLSALGGAIGQGRAAGSALEGHRPQPAGLGQDLRPDDRRSGAHRVAGHLRPAHRLPAVRQDWLRPPPTPVA